MAAVGDLAAAVSIEALEEISNQFIWTEIQMKNPFPRDFSFGDNLFVYAKKICDNEPRTLRFSLCLISSRVG